MGPERWKWGDFGAYRTQKADFPGKLALWIDKARFSYIWKRDLILLRINVILTFIYNLTSNVISWL